jgi:hypothetical protein
MTDKAKLSKEIKRLLGMTAEDAVRKEYEKARGIKPEPKMGYHYGGFGYEETPPFGWGQ